MKYFTYRLLATANGWTDASDAEVAEATAAFAVACDAYWAELDGLSSRVSGPAWHFFRHGSDEHGLHDGRLLSFCIGDGLAFRADGSTPFRIDRSVTSAAFSFLNYKLTYSFFFEARRVCQCHLATDAGDLPRGSSLGDLYLCELTSTDSGELQLAFLFASGAEISVVFRQLVFRHRRVRRSPSSAET